MNQIVRTLLWVLACSVPLEALAQCASCGATGGRHIPVPPSPYAPAPGLVGGPGPGLHDGPGAVVGPAPGYSVQCNACSQVGPCGPCESCGHWCHYYSEQEKMANDWCRDCCFNWGWQHTFQNALTPRFAPTWYASADALFLLRDGDRDVDFTSYGPRFTDRRNVFLESDDLGDCMESGFKTTVSYSLSQHDNLLVEASYLGFHQWEESASARDPTLNPAGVPGNLTSPFTNFGVPFLVPGFDFNDLVTISFTSELHSAELNFRHRTGLMCGWIETSMVYGIRYMRLDETFLYQQFSNVPLPIGAAHSVDVATTNDLLGGQLGVLGAYRVSDRWWFELDVKATLAGNDARQRTIYARTLGTTATQQFEFNARNNCMAVIGDVNLVSIYQITNNLALRLGYQMIWADGLALASENFSANPGVLTQGPAEVNDNGTLVFHGPHLGIQLTR